MITRKTSGPGLVVALAILLFCAPAWSRGAADDPEPAPKPHDATVPRGHLSSGWDGPLEIQEQAALDAAVEHVTPSVVRIETIGGLEQVGGKFWNAGPTTGLIVDPEGYIVSSAFNFVHRPDAILVQLPDGTRRPARRVAADHARMLVLLKIDAGRPLPVPEIAPYGELRVGQWAVAVGRAFEGDRPYRSVGILSARSRIDGRAIQTDAAVSPNNYGGPLIDIHGRVMGVLVPLSPQANSELAGAEWYDSGIGFAIPAEDVLRVLPRLKRGKDLYPGLAGIGLKGSNPHIAPPIIATCAPRSPAAAAGLAAGDRIVEIDGRPIARAVDVRIALGRHYAGDSVRVAAIRGDRRIEGELTLVETIEPTKTMGNGR